jgi:sigma-B regulation protein RsbU (phosphoserine phosphatase)
MHSVSIMNVLRQRALPNADFHLPSQVLGSLNDMFQMDTHDGMYFSMWYGVYDLRSRTLRYASAGHHPAYLLTADGSEPTALQTRNLVIGAMPGLTFREMSTVVPPGSMLHVFSDGVFEVLTRDGRQWGLPDFLPLLTASAGAAASRSAQLYGAVREVAAVGPLDDDFSMLIVTFP